MMEKPIRNGASSRIVIPVILFTAVCFILLRRIEELDVWYHLVIGQEIVRTLRIPATEFFVYPHLGEPVSFHEWGFGVLSFLAFNAGGYWGMSAANALVATGTLFLLRRAAGKAREMEPVSLLFLGVLLTLLYHRLVYRPEMMLFLCLAAQLFLLERHRSTGSRGWLYPLPFLTMFLGMFHPSAIFLLAVQGFYGVQSVIDSATKRDRARMAMQFIALLAVSFLAAGINPYGFRQVLLPFHFAASADLLQTIVEFLPTFRTGYKYHYIAIAASSLLLLLVQPKRRVVDWLLFFSFGWLGYRFARNVSLFALVMYVPVVRASRDLLARRFGDSGSARKFQWACAALALGAVVALPIRYGSWGAGPVETMQPVQSAQLIKTLRPSGQIFNFYDFGGYLAWELRGRYRVSIDGRHYATDKSLVLHDKVFQAEPGWQELLQEQGVGAIVAPAVLPYSGRLIPLMMKLALDQEWLLLKQEDAGLLFVRRTALPAAPSVPVLDKNQVWRQVMAESRRVLRDYPDQPEAYRSLGKAAMMLRETAVALDAFRNCVRLKPEDKDAAMMLSLLESGRMGPIR